MTPRRQGRLRRNTRNDALITGGPREASDACQAINERRHDEQPDIPSRRVLTSRYLCTEMESETNLHVVGRVQASEKICMHMHMCMYVGHDERSGREPDIRPT